MIGNSNDSIYYTLIAKCETQQELLESATLLCQDFAQFVPGMMGGHNVVINCAYNHDGSNDTLRLVGIEKNVVLIDSVFFLKFGVHQNYDKMWLIKLANALARNMGIRPTTAAITDITNIDNLPAPKQQTNQENKLEIKQHGNLRYIDINFQCLVRDTIVSNIWNTQITNCLELSFCGLTKKIAGENLQDLKYDDQAINKVRDLFSILGSAMPSEDIKTYRRCINPKHNDNNPSMKLTLRPYYWKYSKIIKSKLTDEQNATLEDKYNEGYVQNYTIAGKDIILFCVHATCFSNNCRYNKLLTNNEIKTIY
uniref:Wsv137-like protein n=1 Tax=Pasiphaea japonica whispovirus TaxID=2984286 RepID=A0A9C7C0M6_9VIRU|nr:MAG: wsv137-like protein [Pasiphaea japonica whispovirus]